MKKLRRPPINDSINIPHAINSDAIKNNKTAYTLDPLFDLLDTCICITDEFGNLKDINNAFCKITGYSKQEIIGYNFHTILQTGIDKNKENPYDNEQLAINFWPVNIIIKHKQGYQRQITISFKPINTTLKPFFFIITVKEVLAIKENEINFYSNGTFLNDIKPTKKEERFITNVNSVNRTEIANKQIELSDNKYPQMFKALFENDTDAVSILSATAKLQYVSPSITSVLGYLPAEAMLLTITSLIHPKDLNGLQVIWTSGVNTSLRYLTGQTRW